MSPSLAIRAFQVLCKNEKYFCSSEHIFVPQFVIALKLQYFLQVHGVLLLKKKNSFLSSLKIFAYCKTNSVLDSAICHCHCYPLRMKVKEGFGSSLWLRIIGQISIILVNWLFGNPTPTFDYACTKLLCRCC